MSANKSISVVAAAVLVVAAAAFATVPGTINYQGYLRNTDGSPVNSPVNVTFRLYSSVSGVNPLWSGVPQGVTPSNGIYSTQIGPTALPFDRRYFLGVSVGTDPEMRPLQVLDSVPYAQRSAVADSVPDGSITSARIAGGAVTDAKITGPISGSKIGSAGLNADTVDGLHAADFSRSGATDTGQANLLALVASLQAQINAMNKSSSATSPPIEQSYDVATALSMITGSSVTLNIQVAMDPQGNAMAVWDHITPTREFLVGSNRYSVGSGWGTGVFLDVASGVDHVPHIAMDDLGNAIAVWRQDSNIKASRYTVGVGWGTATLIESDDSGAAKNPQVAMNAAGDAMAVWQQSDGTRDNIWANRYTAGIGWGSAATIETGAGAASDAQVAMSGDNAIAVWSQSDGTRISIFANSYRAGDGWREAELLETDSVRSADKPRVAMDSSGNATVVWQMYTFPGEPFYKVWMSRFSAGSGWGSATEVPTVSTENHDPRVAMDVRGNGLIIWWDIEGVLGRLWSKRYTAGAGWGPASVVEFFDPQYISDHKAAMDAQGNALVTWRKSDGSLVHLWGKRYNAVSGWGTAFQADTSVYGVGDYQLAMDAQGNAVAVYAEWNVMASYLPTTSWKAAALIENDNHGDAGAPQVAMDTQGNATAVWEQSDGERYSIWATRYSPATGWGTPEVIEPDPTQNARAPRVAMDSQGNAIAVWPHFDGIRYNIWSNRYTAGGGWGEPVLLETDDGDARVPRIAMDAVGNAVVVWFQSDGARNNIWANRYSADIGWGRPTLIENNNDGAASAPQVAMDAIGNAMAVWDQDEGKRYNIWSNRYNVGAGWGTAVLIETNDAGTARYPQVKIDAKGSAVAVWQQSDGTRNNIWANRYTTGAGWGSAVPIETDNSGDALLPQIAVDAQGNAVAVWSQSDGTRANIWSNRYSTGIGWGTATLLETDNVGSAGDAQVAMDPQGNALAVWGQNDGTRDNIYGNWYIPGLGWGIPVLLEMDNADSARSPQIAMITQGIATAVWLQSDGTRNNIWSNRRR